MHLLIILVAVFMLPQVVFAERQSPVLESIPDGAPAPPPLSSESLEPEVTIIQRRDQTVEEYRLNGQLYMVKISPEKGFPYYLLDSDGDGDLDTRQDELNPKLMIPHWVILRW